MTMKHELTPYDRIAILMGIDERIYRLCEPLRNGADTSPLARDVVKAQEKAMGKAKSELLASDPDKLLIVELSGEYDSGDDDYRDHGYVDEFVNQKFPEDAETDSEGDCIHIYCNGKVKDDMIAAVKKKFKGISLNVRTIKAEEATVMGLSNWHDAQKWIEQNTLQDHVVVPAGMVSALRERYDALIAQKIQQAQREIADLQKMQAELS